MQSRRLRLGTRRSTLAWAQSLWVAERLRALDSTLAIELIPIETRGDRITDVPLREAEGKEFFTAEIDAALLEGRVDVTVHSLKDLSLERPPGIALAAVPTRENPRDVILFRREIRTRLTSGAPIRIGTSAPRRHENLPPFLRWALPHGSTASIDCVDIRGNVDTRLKRVREAEDAERAIDGVVLALAGLIRLWRDERPDGGRARLEQLLAGLHWMVLPLNECPTAPGQGALAVECRADDKALRGALARLNGAASARQVNVERQVLAQFGGGCHQRFGATCIDHPACGNVIYVRGRAPDGRALNEARWLALPAQPSGRVVAWDGLRARETAEVQDDLTPEIDAAIWEEPSPLFIAHSRALPADADGWLGARRVWTSGSASWRRLAARGIWVEGCAEGLGYDWIASTLNESVLGLPPLAHWQILTHSAAIESWPAGSVIGTYTAPVSKEESIPDAAKITHAFWASGSQFRRLWPELPATVHHASGPGRTAELIGGAGVHNFTVFPSVHEWRKWLRIETSDTTD